MILPAIEVETCHFSPRSSITSLSSPRRGYSSLSLSTAWDSSVLQSRLAQVLGPAGAILQGLEVMGAIAPLPAIEGLWGNVEMATGEASILPMLQVVVHPLQPLPGLLRQLGEPDQAATPRSRSTNDTHNTIIVSLIFLNEVNPYSTNATSHAELLNITPSVKISMS